MPLSLAKTTPPSTDPVTLAEAKAWAKISGTAQDDKITALISTAVSKVEEWTRRQLMDATFTLKLDCFPAKVTPIDGGPSQSVIRLPRAPLDSVTSITYLDTADATQTLADTVYNVDTTSEPGRVFLANGQDWPDILEEIHAVTVTYVAGYGAASDVPEAFKTMIKWLVEHWLDWPGVVTSCSINEIPFALRCLINLHSLPEAA